MKYIKVFLTITVCAASALNMQGQSLKLDGVAVIQLKSSEVANSIPVSIQASHSFPGMEYTEVNDTLTSQAPARAVPYPVRTYTDAWISIGPKRQQVLLIPGDTISVQVAGSGDKLTMTMGGKNKTIQDYYVAKGKKFNLSMEQLFWNVSTGKDLKTYMRKADSLYAVEQKFWDQYKKSGTLPATFVRYESDAMRYRNAQSRIYVRWYKTVVDKNKQEVPSAYYAFLNNTPLNNKEARYDRAYLMFLDSYFMFKTTNGYQKDHDQAAVLDLARKTLDNEYSDFYVLYNISEYLISQPSKVINDLDNRKFPDDLQEFVTYIRKKAEAKTKFLGPGDKAPDFLLENTIDSLVTLSQFRDSVVYLSFWFAGCKPCIEEFPRENELVKKFQNMPVKIVGICTMTRKEKWLDMISKHQLQMANLYANPGWTKKLEENYAVLAYPHYVLIGADGKIIENYASRPGDISEKIEKAVSAIANK